VHLEGAHPAEVHFRFEQDGTRLGWSILTGFGLQSSLLVLLLFISLYGSGKTSAATPPPVDQKNIVWLNEPGPGGGGGGGGNRMKEPPRPAEDPGKDKITVPVAKPPEAPKITKEEPTPSVQLEIPAKNMASATESLPGAVDVTGPPSLSQGSGSGGTGGGAYRPGSGVTTPILVREVKPAYTADAMRAKIQGSVLVEGDVQTDGTVTNLKVVRSLDPTFGLDQEAIKAARQWRFQPGKRFGEAVAVTITIELTFTLR
jgi:TonB family protein